MYEDVPVFRDNLLVTSIPLNKSVGLSVDEKLDYIMKKLQLLDGIAESINKLDGRVTTMERRVDLFESKNTEFEKTIDFVANKVDEFEKQCKRATEQIKKCNNASEQMKKQAQKYQQDLDKVRDDVGNIGNQVNTTSGKPDELMDLKDLKDTVLDLKCRSMKNNLIFTGLGGETNSEDTEKKLRDFLYYEVEIEKNIEFNNVHRFGRFVRGKDRPIVARLLYHADVIHIIKNSYKLQGTPYGIHEQFPKEIEDKRRLLYPIQKRFRKSGHKTKLVRDKLYIDGKLYLPEDPSDEPQNTSEAPAAAARSAPYSNTNRTNPGALRMGNSEAPTATARSAPYLDTGRAKPGTQHMGNPPTSTSAARSTPDRDTERTKPGADRSDVRIANRPPVWGNHPA